MDPAAIAERLREIARYLRLAGDNPWKARAYDTAAESVETLGPRLAALVESGRLTDAPGIGKGTAAVITEIVTTGTTQRLEAMRAEMPPSLLALAELPGLTLPRIRALHAELGVGDVDDLREAVAAGRLREVKGFGPRTEDKIRVALARPPVPPRRIRLIDGRELGTSLARSLAHAPGVVRAEVAGGVRRWKETVGTLRLVAAADDARAALDGFALSWLLSEAVTGDARSATLRGRLPGAGPVEVTAVAPPRFAAAW